MITYNDVIKSSGIDYLDSKYLLAHILNCDIVDISVHLSKTINTLQHDNFTNLCEQRKNGKPVDLLLGSRGFWNGEFKITTDVLSPRPDTETIIETVLKSVPDIEKPLKILDLGTGSGCIIISLLSEYKNAIGLGVDISSEALLVASYNAIMNGVNSRCDFIESNWWNSIDKQKFDIIVSNPPYITNTGIDDLMVEVKMYDPMLALAGGDDGLDSYREISNRAKEYLTNNGIIVVEFGINQENSVENIFKNNNFTLLKTVKDLYGINRVQSYN